MVKEKNFKLVISLCIVILVLVFLVSLALGKANILSLKQDIGKIILINVRLPRVILAMVVGMGLSISGVVLQSLLNNPLADSYTLGISSGAALGACIAIYINIATSKDIPIQFMAVIFSMLVFITVLKIAKAKGIITTSSLVLAGIIVSSTCQAGVSFIKSISDEDSVSIIYWLMGNLSSKSLKQAFILTVFVMIGFFFCVKYSSELNIMTLGRKEAILLGVDYDRVYKIFLVVCSIITALCVSLCGIIGFVGLVVPHIARLLLGADNKKVIPASALMGAILLLVADTVTRSMLKNELPVGVLTTLIGGPFFCYIFINRKNTMEN
ncbi:iron ABC transporter permease [Clostridium oceanicum]|uniref:Iron ABC transporter permease n=1 Tax=Clostridium oceanicum TaxID=1543 RepID=A0ABP3UNQ1_9CLOT